MRKEVKAKAFFKIFIVFTMILGLNFSILKEVVIATDEVDANSELVNESENNSNSEENTNTNTNSNSNENADNSTANSNIENNNSTPIVVEKKSLQDLKIVVNTKHIYSYLAEERRPVVKVYDGNTKLTENKDYTITYHYNVNPGRAKIKIKGRGNYTGKVLKFFYIAPGKAKIKSVKFNSTATRATITWRKDDKASGYKIFMSKSRNGKYTWIKTIQNKNTLSFTKKGLNPKKEYYFKVAAYKEIEGNKVYKKLSEPKTQDKLIATVTLTASSSGSNRNHNLKLASEKISGLVLKPGETFNWFKVVGPASKARGYLEASVFQNGKTVKGYGGGVCQVSTTLYQASLKVGLQIVERHQHSKPVTYTKLGKDATVSYGVQNLRIKNNKNYSIRIVTSAEKGSTTCKLYKVGD